VTFAPFGAFSPAGANRQPLPHAQVGWITIVTTR
jgi:hypothetical protein